MRFSIRALVFSFALILISGNVFSEIVNWGKLLKESVDDEGYAKPGKGIDIIYTKPASEKEWGEIVADRIGLDHYKKSYAFVVGISRFRDEKAFDTLNNAKDAISMAKFLADEAGYDYVHLLTEEKAEQQRIKSIMMDTFRTKIDDNDTFLFYWSGHGTTISEKGFLPLLGSDSQRLSSMVAMDDILDWDKLLKAKQVFYLLDSCFSGLATTSMSDSVPLEIEDLAGPGRHILVAGTKRQKTIVIKAKQTSIFTMSLLEGLQGDADGSYPGFPPDGVISARELSIYVRKRVGKERRYYEWKNPITPRLRDIGTPVGEFFFVTKRKGGQARRKSEQKETGAREIKEVQEILRDLGYNPGPVDGIGGIKTRAAIRKFQRDKGLNENGNLNSATLEAIEKAWSDATRVVGMSKRQKKPEGPKREPDLETYITNSLGMKFVLIPAGTFRMGSKFSPDEVAQKYGGEAEWRRDEHPQHSVEITKAFYLQTTEVTQGQWKNVMGDNPSRFKDCGDDCPVEKVSWNDAQEFISKLNKMEGTNKYRLPTEAEWEYACRAGTTTPFFTGDCLSADQANYNGNNPGENCPKGEYREKTVKVGSFQPNAWGIYDMHGNVWEWCQDWYDKNYYDISSEKNPQGPQTGADRVVRGGSWFNVAHYCRSASRNFYRPGYRNSGVGFRLSRSVTLGP